MNIGNLNTIQHLSSTNELLQIKKQQTQQYTNLLPQKSQSKQRGSSATANNLLKNANQKLQGQNLVQQLKQFNDNNQNQFKNNSINNQTGQNHSDTAFSAGTLNSQQNCKNDEQSKNLLNSMLDHIVQMQQSTQVNTFNAQTNIEKKRGTTPNRMPPSGKQTNQVPSNFIQLQNKSQVSQKQVFAQKNSRQSQNQGNLISKPTSTKTSNNQQIKGIMAAALASVKSNPNIQKQLDQQALNVNTQGLPTSQQMLATLQATGFAGNQIPTTVFKSENKSFIQQNILQNAEQFGKQNFLTIGNQLGIASSKGNLFSIQNRIGTQNINQNNIQSFEKIDEDRINSKTGNLKNFSGLNQSANQSKKNQIQFQTSGPYLSDSEQFAYNQEFANNFKSIQNRNEANKKFDQFQEQDEKIKSSSDYIHTDEDENECQNINIQSDCMQRPDDFSNIQPIKQNDQSKSMKIQRRKNNLKSEERKVVSQQDFQDYQNLLINQKNQNDQKGSSKIEKKSKGQKKVQNDNGQSSENERMKKQKQNKSKNEMDQVSQHNTLNKEKAYTMFEQIDQQQTSLKKNAKSPEGRSRGASSHHFGQNQSGNLQPGTQKQLLSVERQQKAIPQNITHQNLQKNNTMMRNISKYNNETIQENNVDKSHENQEYQIQNNNDTISKLEKGQNKMTQRLDIFEDEIIQRVREIQKYTKGLNQIIRKNILVKQDEFKNKFTSLENIVSNLKIQESNQEQFNSQQQFINNQNIQQQQYEENEKLQQLESLIEPIHDQLKDFQEQLINKSENLENVFQHIMKINQEIENINNQISGEQKNYVFNFQQNQEEINQIQNKLAEQNQLISILDDQLSSQEERIEQIIKAQAELKNDLPNSVNSLKKQDESFPNSKFMDKVDILEKNFQNILSRLEQESLNEKINEILQTLQKLSEEAEGRDGLILTQNEDITNLFNSNQQILDNQRIFKEQIDKLSENMIEIAKQIEEQPKHLDFSENNNYLIQQVKKMLDERSQTQQNEGIEDKLSKKIELLKQNFDNRIQLSIETVKQQLIQLQESNQQLLNEEFYNIQQNMEISQKNIEKLQLEIQSQAESSQNIELQFQAQLDNHFIEQDQRLDFFMKKILNEKIKPIVQEELLVFKSQEQIQKNDEQQNNLLNEIQQQLDDYKIENEQNTNLSIKQLKIDLEQVIQQFFSKNEINIQQTIENNQINFDRFDQQLKSLGQEIFNIQNFTKDIQNQTFKQSIQNFVEQHLQNSLKLQNKEIQNVLNQNNLQQQDQQKQQIESLILSYKEESEQKKEINKKIEQFQSDILTIKNIINIFQDQNFQAQIDYLKQQLVKAEKFKFFLPQISSLNGPLSQRQLEKNIQFSQHQQTDDYMTINQNMLSQNQNHQSTQILAVQSTAKKQIAQNNLKIENSSNLNNNEYNRINEQQNTVFKNQVEPGIAKNNIDVSPIVQHLPSSRAGKDTDRDNQLLFGQDVNHFHDFPQNTQNEKLIEKLNQQFDIKFDDEINSFREIIEFKNEQLNKNKNEYENEVESYNQDEFDSIKSDLPQQPLNIHQNDQAISQISLDQIELKYQDEINQEVLANRILLEIGFDELVEQQLEEICSIINRFK